MLYSLCHYIEESISARPTFCWAFLLQVGTPQKNVKLTIDRDEYSDEELDVVSEAQSQALIRPDKPVDFIIDDSPKIGLGCSRAVKTFGR